MHVGAPLLRELAYVAHQSCRELLEHYCVARYGRNNLASDLPAYRGSVALIGPDVRGNCIVTADASALRAAVDLPLAGSALLDWVGEIANQLAGRIKHRLGRRGLNTVLALPVTIVGDIAYLSSTVSDPSGAQVGLTCRRQGVTVDVHLDLDLALDRVELPSEHTEDPISSEAAFVAFDLEFCTSLAPKRAG
jgi:CheY-specific phosphatase CheX